MSHEYQAPIPAVEYVHSDERRNHPRRVVTATVYVVREWDAAARMLPATVLDISVGGIGLVSWEQLEVGQPVRIRLQNDVQRFLKEARGVVRWMSPTEDGEFRLGIEIRPRLAPNELMSLTCGWSKPGPGAGKTWM